jgi:hypothetical protein
LPERTGCQIRPQSLAGTQFDQLFELNRQGCGIFFMVNPATGDKNADVTGIRAVFADLDGAPLESVTGNALQPHVIVETSPGRYQVYWKVLDCPLERFTPLQKAIAKRCNLARIMRLPGFYHLKAEPFLTRIVTIGEMS